jgi:hypothetical protein
MLLECGNALHPLLGTLDEKLTKEVSDAFTPILIHIGLSILYFLEQFISILGVKRGKTVHQFVNDGPQAPPVHCFAVPLLLDHFRSQVLRRPTD